MFMHTPCPAARTRRGLRGLAVLLASGVLASGPAAAADTDRPPDRYVAFGGGYMSPGDRNADYGIGFNLAYAGRLAPRRWWEARIFTTVLETGQSTQPDSYQSGVGLDLIQSFSDESRAHLYALGGAGLAVNDASPDTEDGTSYYANAGLGVRGTVWRDWGVRPRVDLRVTYDSFGDGVSDVLLNFALEIPPKREKVVERVVEVEKIVEVPVEVEKIVEKEVVCVVPPTETVQAALAESDTDRDGVPDDRDACPDTLAGAKVDPRGCVVEEQKITLPNIEFESGSTVLATGGKQKLEEVVSFLRTQSDVKVDIFGHTDSQGRDSYNQKLSEGRAESVMDYLISRGIGAGRLSARGFGETQPIATNETAEGRALNRRVELLLRTK
jgi:OmpA-OmpF porin, OOP family